MSAETNKRVMHRFTEFSDPTKPTSKPCTMLQAQRQ